MKLFITLFVLFFTTGAHAVQTALTVQELSETDYLLAASAADQTNGNSFANPNGDIFFLISSTAGTSIATFDAALNTYEIPGYGPVTKADLAVTVTVGATRLVGPFQSRVWNQSGSVLVSYTDAFTASTTIKAFRLKPSLLRN